MQVLLAVTILAILAGLALPSYAEKLRKERCRRNVRLINMTVLRYCNDFDELYPVHGQTPTASSKAISSASWPANALAD